jgi:hypothetical protein
MAAMNKHSSNTISPFIDFQRYSFMKPITERDHLDSAIHPTSAVVPGHSLV